MEHEEMWLVACGVPSYAYPASGSIQVRQEFNLLKYPERNCAKVTRVFQGR